MNKKNNIIKINNNLINEKMNKMTTMTERKKSKKIFYCEICNKKFNKIYNFDKFFYTSLSIHNLQIHNEIDYDLYINIAKYDIIDDNIIYIPFDTNEINIIDGLYEEGSKKIYTDKNKNIFDSKESKYSEHYGLLYFEKDKLKNVVVELETRLDKNDSSIYMPQNSLEALKVKYIFHTHPKTPHIGSRINLSIIYEFPSLSDIIHFIEHHNRGILIGSLIITPEGIYNIRKMSFNNEKIKIDYDIFISEMDEIYIESFKMSMKEYKNDIDKKNYLINEDFFYKNVAKNLNYIKKINDGLIKYDITIDYYNRVYFNDKWIFPTIYLPFI